MYQHRHPHRAPPHTIQLYVCERRQSLHSENRKNNLGVALRANARAHKRSNRVYVCGRCRRETVRNISILSREDMYLNGCWANGAHRWNVWVLLSPSRCQFNLRLNMLGKAAEKPADCFRKNNTRKKIIFWIFHLFDPIAEPISGLII